MKYIYPFKLVKGRNLYYISFSYKYKFNLFYDVQWGTMYSDVLYTLGDVFTSFKFKSGYNKHGLIPIEYYFIDFYENIEDREKFINSDRSVEEMERYKISCKPMDIKEDAIQKKQTNLILIDNYGKKNYIFGQGIINFEKSKIYLDIFNNYHIKLLSFCENRQI